MHFFKSSLRDIFFVMASYITRYSNSFEQNIIFYFLKKNVPILTHFSFYKSDLPSVSDGEKMFVCVYFSVLISQIILSYRAW